MENNVLAKSKKENICCYKLRLVGFKIIIEHFTNPTKRIIKSKNEEEKLKSYKIN